MTLSKDDINVDDLRVFIQVVDSGGLTAAGRVLGRSTKQISRQIRRLEVGSGQVLFARTTRAIRPTEAAMRLYPHAIDAIAAMDRAAVELSEQNPMAGWLRVAVPTLMVPAGLAGWIARLRELHPGLRVHVRVADRPLDLVAEGLDLQVVATRPTQQTRVVRRLMTITPRLAAHTRYLDSRGRPAIPQDLGDHDCLLFVADEVASTWTLAKGPNTAKITVKATLQSDSSDLLARGLQAGLGIGVCPPGWLEARGEWAGLEAVLPEWHLQPMPLYATMPQLTRNTARIQAFLDAAVYGLRGWVEGTTGADAQASGQNGPPGAEGSSLQIG